jgi:hypothetical protein
VAEGKSCKQWDRHALSTATGHRQLFLAAGTTIDKGPQQRKVLSKIFEDAFEIAFEASHAGPCLTVMTIPPRHELLRNDFLNGLAKCQVRRTARATPNEVVLAQRQTGGQVGDLDQSTDAPVRWRRQPEPVPPALDNLAKRTDRDPVAVRGRELVPLDIAQR